MSALSRLRVAHSLVTYVFSRDFFAELAVYQSRMSLGRYRRHNGDSLPYFFSRTVDLHELLVDGVPIKQSVQYARVSEVLSGKAPEDSGTNHMGRDVSRTRELVAERDAGRDSFVLCLIRNKEGKLNIEDGATRASLLLLTGESKAPAVITGWK